MPAEAGDAVRTPCRVAPRRGCATGESTADGCDARSAPLRERRSSAVVRPALTRSGTVAHWPDEPPSRSTEVLPAPRRVRRRLRRRRSPSGGAPTPGRPAARRRTRRPASVQVTVGSEATSRDNLFASTPRRRTARHLRVHVRRRGELLDRDPGPRQSPSGPPSVRAATSTELSTTIVTGGRRPVPRGCRPRRSATRGLHPALHPSPEILRFRPGGECGQLGADVLLQRLTRPGSTGCQLVTRAVRDIANRHGDGHACRLAASHADRQLRRNVAAWRCRWSRSAVFGAARAAST